MGGRWLMLAALLLDAACRDSRVAVTKRPEAARDAAETGPPSVDASAPPPKAALVRAETGPFEIPLIGSRNVYYVAPHAPGTQRVMAMLHGVCNPPGYTCGLWAETAKDLGFLICPTGDGSCGPSMYNAPTWNEPNSKIDEDLELSIAKVETIHPGELARADNVLLGFSRGAYAAAKIAAAHPGRWPFLVLIEADVPLSKKMLEDAGVRAVALVAGEIGGQIGGERKTANSLLAQGFPARLWVMKKAGHHYSADIEAIMREAITWITSQPSMETKKSKDSGP